MSKTSPSGVVIGIGNQLRGDDAAGLEAVRRLAATKLPVDVGVVAHEGEGADLLELWQDVDAVLLVDCVRSGERPGTIHRLDASSAPVAPALSHGSSHAISVTDAIELARTLGRLPPRVVIYGIEGATFHAGAGLSPEVATALDGLVAAVRVEALALGRACITSAPAIT